MRSEGNEKNFFTKERKVFNTKNDVSFLHKEKFSYSTQKNIKYNPNFVEYQNKPHPMNIAAGFLEKFYYDVTHSEKNAELYYENFSSIQYGLEGQNTPPFSDTIHGIGNALIKSGFVGGRISISSFDAVAGMNGGVIIFVVGHLKNESKSIKKTFVQTFTLAPRTYSGYFILTDICRLSKEETFLPDDLSEKINGKKVFPVESLEIEKKSKKEQVFSESKDKIKIDVKENTPIVSETKKKSPEKITKPSLWSKMISEKKPNNEEVEENLPVEITTIKNKNTKQSSVKKKPVSVPKMNVEKQPQEKKKIDTTKKLSKEEDLNTKEPKIVFVSKAAAAKKKANEKFNKL